MFNKLINELKNHPAWDNYKDYFIEKKYSNKSILLNEGEIATKIFFIKQGCLRMWFNKDGKDITFQFFIENQVLASIESFISNQPSMFTIETIEPSTIISITKDNFKNLLVIFPRLKDGFQDVIYHRFRNYSQLFLSRIKDTPKERYNDLIKNHPELIQRIPQHYIASFLGITPISLSRIRNKK